MLLIPRDRTIIILSQEEDVPANLKGHLRIRYDSSELTSLRTALKAKISEVLPSTLMRRTQSNAIGPGRSLWVEDSIPHRSEIPTEALTLREQARAEILSGNLVVARTHLTEAIALAPGAWEARYDLAVVLSRLKYEDDAWSLAMEVAEEAESMADLATAFKAYNLISGIEKRRQRLSEALAAMRKSYELAEQHAFIKEKPVHVVVMKNLAVLEVLNDNQSKFEAIIEKLREHPDIQSVLPLLEQEIGHQLLSS